MSNATQKTAETKTETLTAEQKVAKAEAAAKVEAGALNEARRIVASWDAILSGGKGNEDAVRQLDLLEVITKLHRSAEHAETKGKELTPLACERIVTSMTEEDAVEQVRKAFRIKDGLERLLTLEVQPMILGPHGPAQPRVVASQFIDSFLLPSSKSGKKDAWKTATAVAKRKCEEADAAAKGEKRDESGDFKPRT